MEAMGFYENTNTGQNKIPVEETGQNFIDQEVAGTSPESEESTAQDITTEREVIKKVSDGMLINELTELVHDQNALAAINEQLLRPHLLDIKSLRDSYEAAINLSDSGSLGQTGLGFTIQGTARPNRILTFDAAAAGKSYRIVQSGTSLVDGIAVNVGTGNSVDITIAGINLVRPAITVNGDGTAFGIYSGGCTIQLEANSTNTLATSATGAAFANLTALTVAPNTVLTIKGTGKLRAYSGKTSDYPFQSAAGIGGNILGFGDIIINSGDITATGAYGGAGIGTGDPSETVSGSITIAGGIIQATGGRYATGIGTGLGALMNDIIVSGGQITAIGGEQSAGIGAGGQGTVRSITINAGSILAQGGLNGAAIGSSCSAGGVSVVDSIVITGGVIEAVGGAIAPGIGAGKTGRVGIVDIRGGDIDASGIISGCGIGSTMTGITNEINISGGAITASGAYCGIGAGGNNAKVQVAKISGSETVVNAKATGGTAGAGIGAAGTGAILEQIVISGGQKVTAVGTAASGTTSPGAGIGAAYLGSVKIINISGGNITAKGTTSGYIGVGIGTVDTVMDNITITGGIIEASGYKESAGIGCGASSHTGSIQNINIYGGKITAIGGDRGSGIGTGARGNIGNITIGKNGDPAGDLEIEATAGRMSSGIGATEYGYCKNIIIYSGKIIAIGTFGGPGIGMMTGPANGKIQINGGIIQATGGSAAAAIGTGTSGNLSQLEEIVINGGDITATAGTNGVGIGWMFNNFANSKVGKILISDGTVKATAMNNYGVGIGMGWSTGASNKYWGAEVQITGGTVVAMGTDAGIGSRYQNAVTAITISGGDVTAVGGALTVGGKTTKGPGIGRVYPVSGYLQYPQVQIDKEAMVRAFSTAKNYVNSLDGNISSPAISGTISGTAYLMNFQIDDDKVNQAIHDVYINTDDMMYQGPLREPTDSFYSFAYTTGGEAKTHSYRLIANSSDDGVRLGHFYEKGTTLDTFTSKRNDQGFIKLEAYLYPPSESKLTPNKKLVESGEAVTWNLSFKNTSLTDSLKRVTFSLDFLAGGMQLVPNSVKFNGYSVPDSLLQSAGIALVPPGDTVTVELKTIVTGAINQKRILNVDISSELGVVGNVSNYVYIKNRDASYPGDWAQGLGLWSVPKEFKFNYIDIKDTPTIALLNPNDYQPYTQSGGLYTRIYENGVNSSNGWKLNVSLGQFENEQNPTDILDQGTKLEMTVSLKKVKYPNQDPEVLEPPLDDQSPKLINSQISLFPGAPPVTLINTASGTDVGTWDLLIPINKVRLNVPLADPGMAGAYYHSTLIWSLEMTP